MDNKIILAIAAAVIVVAAGVGGAVYLLKDDSDSTDVDVVRDDLRVGDKIDYHFSMDMTEKTTTDTKEIFLGWIGEHDGAPVDTIGTQYKGKNIICDIYEFTVGECQVTTWNLQTSGFLYKKIENEGGIQTTYTLNDTNMDMDKIVSTLEVSAGDFYKYDVSGSTENGMMVGVFEKHVTAVEPNVIIESTQKEHTEEDYSKEIVQISDNKYILKGDSTPKTKDDVLSLILYSSFIKDAADKGKTLTHGDKTSGAVKTDDGYRDVTIEKITATYDDETVNYVLYYGKEGMIYKIEASSEPGSEQMSSVLVFVSSNLVSKK
ncbi:MAG: hypothetical protein MJZ21_03200 [archaeon]|nr:hypothetical protein [archaeon]